MSVVLEAWKSLPKNVRIIVSGGAPALVMAAGARASGYSDVATIAWGGLAGFAGSVTEEAITGDGGQGPIIDTAAFLAKVSVAHPWIIGIGAVTGVLGTMIVSGLISDLALPEILPFEIEGLSAPYNPFAANLNDVIVGWNVVLLGTGAFVGVWEGVGFIYVMQGLDCAFKWLNDPLSKPHCTFGPTSPLWPST